MSFASDTKSELCNVSENELCCKKAMLAGILSFSATKAHNTTKITTENIAVGRLIISLIRNLYRNLSPKVSIVKRGNSHLFVIEIPDSRALMGSLGLGGISMRIHPSIVRRDCCKKAFVKGAFLGGGSISDPNKSYHMEISTKHLTLMNDFQKLLSAFGINVKTIERNGSHVFYFKNSEQISDMLALMGAHTTMMNFLNIKLTKEIRNNANRLYNCDMANLDKTSQAAVKQKQAIDIINTHIGLDLLPDDLQELAWLRLSNMEASLKELGECLSPPLNKSAVNRRMKKLITMAEDFKKTPIID